MDEYSNKIIKKNSGILLGSVETHDCDPYMDCPECKGTGTCQECKGQGDVKCHTCHGSGQCKDCHGKGQWRCSECGGSGNCRRCQGTGDVQCKHCHGRGRVQYKDVNGNTGWKDCPKCGGSGSTPCPDCRSGMQTAAKALDIITFGAGATYGHGSGKCSKCGGSGEITCKTCSGSGNCQTCEGSGQLTCNHCSGSGNCPNCDNGKVTCERCEGSGYYQTFIRRTSTLYSKGWQWSGSTEYRDIIKASYGIKLHDGTVKKWKNARTVETDIVEETNQKCAAALEDDKDLYTEFLSKYVEQTELSSPNHSSDKPYAKELTAQRIPITKIKYTINEEEYEVAIIGDNNIVATKSVPTTIKGFELSKWQKIKLAMTEKSRLKAYARLAAYIFQCDGKSMDESNILNSMIRALNMSPQAEGKFKTELGELNGRMPYEKVRKMIKPLLHSKKTITFAWQCMAVDKEITQEEQSLFEKIVSEYNIEQSEIESLKGLANKFSKLKSEQIAIEYANLSEEFAEIRKNTWRAIITTIFIIVIAIGLTTFSLLRPTSLSINKNSYDTVSQLEDCEANIDEEISEIEDQIDSEITEVVETESSVENVITEQITANYNAALKADNEESSIKKYCSAAFISTYNRYQEAIEGEIGDIDYDLWLQAQDAIKPSAEVIEVTMKGDSKAEVDLGLTNAGTKSALTVVVIKDGESWKIDDFVNAGQSVVKIMKDNIKAFSK